MRQSDSEIDDERISAPPAPAKRGFHLMAKPVGPRCNLRCTYCFYREKEVFFSDQATFLMPDDVLEAYVRKYIASQPGNLVVFDWQGGEPVLAGMNFFRRALDLQKKYGAGKHIHNTLQTNGTLLDDAWCAFLARNKFLVGLSLDGPAAVHDACRVDRDGGGTCADVLRALGLLQRHGVDVNVLATVNRESSRHPLEVYRFFREHGVQYIQFIPVVEREPEAAAEKPEPPRAAGPSLAQGQPFPAVTAWSVEPEPYGEFLLGIFREWSKADVGAVFVMNFEWALGAWAGAGPGVCYLAPRCGQSLILEHNGDIYSCDHFMYPGYRLGNILDGDLRKTAESQEQLAFGAAKETALPGYCRACEFLFACRGGCPKHRFRRSPEGEPGLNYLCAGLKEFYREANPLLKRMADLIRRGIPASQWRLDH